MQPFQTSTYNRLNSRWLQGALFLTAVSVVLIIHQILPGSPSVAKALHAVRHTSHHPQHRFQDVKKPETHVKAIPNVVHFVHFMLESEETWDLRFREFLSIYSAHLYQKPETLYIHTNVPEDEIEALLDRSDSPWTKAVRKLPAIKFSYHLAPNQTSKGLAITDIAHKTDFTRIDVLSKYGGIYLDDDAYILQPLHPFLNAGFENVVGAQLTDIANPSAILSTKGNKYNDLFLKLMDRVFDGSWTAHSVNLMDQLTLEFHTIPNQVLRLPQFTFFPYSWNEDDLKVMYLVHDKSEPAAPVMENKPLTNETDFIENFHLWPPGKDKTWQVDWRLSYILHGWNHVAQHMGEKLFGKYGEISLEYVMALDSNFARAVEPAVRHALRSGVLDHLDVDKHALETRDVET